MTLDYLSRFPVPAADLPPRLRSLFEPVGDEPRLEVEVTTRYDVDQFGPEREYEHMIMIAAPMHVADQLKILPESSHGVVYFSTPDIRHRGGLSKFTPSASGFDYIVASWGDGSYFSYALAEKIWMALGLSPRCIGGDDQAIVYDDLSLPEFGVARGEISNEYFYTPKRSIKWTMSNEYLRRYLWMRGSYGVRVFFYEAILPDIPSLRKLMAGSSQICRKLDGDWCKFDIREHNRSLLLQVWATVAAIPPDRCPEQTADGLLWPGVSGPMTHNRADALTTTMPVYLDDKFLKKYEQQSLFDTTPVRSYDRWLCGPSYRGQWDFSGCERVGRNLILVPMRELYKPKPDREILHAYAHAVNPQHVAGLNLDEEHIVSKTQRFLDQILILGDGLSELGAVVGKQRSAAEIVRLSRVNLQAEGWSAYPQLCRLAQVASLDMTEQDFLSRCKNIHEFWQPISNSFMRSLIEMAGHPKENFKDLGSLKLLQVLSNIIERLNSAGEHADAFGAGTDPEDLRARNAAFAPLFVTNDLRIADAHQAGDVLKKLAELGFDTAALNEGYGRALDYVFDGVIGTFAHINAQLSDLLTY